ncbi:fatty-acid amide hydrolase 2-A isoform X2 [Dendroctonus ponderosae]|uniref:Amidase domain-containing protein n=1 Tax=Dendroctonus ponderosae TaxID=77166 RepID=A0AAR5QKQ5_DENPD|nr:fatty-acid amide hydrolase 2-A isoform X2 [Dendroctonus ponderosae]
MRRTVVFLKVVNSATRFHIFGVFKHKVQSDAVKSMVKVHTRRHHTARMMDVKTTKVSKARYYIFKLFLCLRYYLDLLIDRLFGIYYDSKREYIPKVKNQLVLESATALARKIQRRELTSVQVVEAFIERIQQVNPIINAIVDNRFEDALSEARQIDQDIANGTIQEVDFQDKPFLGVPFTSKESTAAKGLSWTFGLKKRQGKKASFDAHCIESMKKSGAILLGVSNVPQLNLWQETSNPVFGLTRNPYNTTRNVGGSSGGEAAILAACGSPLGVGTDIGGSARIPAFMCGVFGHKISNSIVSTKGLTYRTGEEEETMVCVGPLARHVDDLLPFIKLLAGSNADRLNLGLQVPVKKLKVYYVTNPKDPLMSPFREEMHSVLLKAVRHLEGLCLEKPQELVFEQLQHQYKLWKYWMSLEMKNFRKDLNNREGDVNAVWEIIKHFLFGGDFTTATVFNLINGFLKPVNSVWAVEVTQSLKEAFLTKLDDNSVLLYPSAPFPASYHNAALLRPYNFDCFALWNTMKFPVTQVPMGLGKEGLPLGVQVVAAPDQDRLCLAVAKELEREFGGFVPPVIVADK